MKKWILISFAVLVILAISLFIVLFFKNKQNSVVPIPSDNVLTNTQIIIPTEKSNIPVNNYYKDTSSTILSEKDVLMETNENFDILAYNYNNKKSFLIYLKNAAALVTSRKNAEDSFLKKLGITEEQACLLDVSLTVSNTIEESAAKNYGLSFCSNSLALPLSK